MKYLFTLLAAVALTMPVQAQSIVKISALPAGTTPSGSELIPAVQSSFTVYLTAAQMRTYIQTGLIPTSAIGVSVEAYDATILKSAMLGSTVQAYYAPLNTFGALSAPSANGMLLAGTTGGTFSWVPQSVLATTSGTNTYTATPSPALASYVTGMQVVIKFANANTGGASLNLNSLGAVPIQQLGLAIVAGQISAGATLALVYDGSNFQIIGNYTSVTYTLDTDGTLAADSDTRVPSQKAVVTYVGTHAGGPVMTSPTFTSTLATDASVTTNLLVVQVGTLTGNITLSNPTGATNRERIEYVLKQDGTGSRTVTLDTKFRIPSSSTMTSPINAPTDFTTAGKKSRLAVEYDAADDKFDVISFVPGY